ncbi:MAG: S-layer homology domain-containing protein, partial [Cohnella sp.]|nr:S-layer homology domain-containing protein [Cohnella sp.]
TWAVTSAARRPPRQTPIRSCDGAVVTTLTVNQGTIHPAFTPSIERYTLSVGNDVTELQVIGTYGVMGSVTLNGDAYSSGTTVTVPLHVGQNTISIEVTSEDGLTTKTYSLAVTRADAPSSSGPSPSAGAAPLAPPTVRVSSSTLITPREQTGVTVEQSRNAAMLRLMVSSDRLQAIADAGNLADEITIDTTGFDTGRSEIVLPLGSLLALNKARDPITIELLTSSGAYRLPLAELGSLPSQPGATVAIRVLQDQTSEAPPWTNGRLVSPIVGFEVWVQGSSSTELIAFKLPVEREIAIDQSYDPSRSTAVRILADGTLEPVPTRFIGKKAIIQSFTNSQYAVVELNKKYSDIQGSNETSTAILKLANKQIISGYADGTFRPDGQITKAEAAALIYRALGGTREPIPNAKFYRDVKATSWYAPAVVSLTKRGILSGAGNGKFNPNELVTREQLAVMIVNAMKHIDRSLLPLTTNRSPVVFTDAAKQSKWAAEPIAMLANAGILTGNKDGTLDPRGAATRAETA